MPNGTSLQEIRRRLREEAGEQPSSVQPSQDGPGFGVSGLFRVLRAPQQALITGPLREIGLARQEQRPLSPVDLIRAGVRGVREDVTGREAVEAFGLEGKTATGTGLALELIADPLWFLAPAKVARLIGLPAGVQALKATRAGQVVTRGIQASPTVQRLGRALVTDYGKPKEFVRAQDQLMNKLGAPISDLSERMQKTLTLPEQRRVTQFMEPQEWKKLRSGEIVAKNDPRVGRSLRKGDKGREQVLLAAQKAGENAQEINKLGRESVGLFSDLHDELLEAGVLERWNKLKSPLVGGYRRRLYRIFEGEGSALQHLKGLLPTERAIAERAAQKAAGMTRSAKRMRIDPKEYAPRQRMTPELDKAYGLINEAPYHVAKGELIARHAIATRTFFNEVAKRFSKDSVEAGFRALPKTKALGPLAGRAVPDAIYDDIMKRFERPGEIARMWKQGVGWWKYGKVIINPASNARNMISNTMLAHVAGLAPFKIHRYAQGARSLFKHDKWYQEAQREGASFLQDTFVGAELPQLLADTVPGLQSGLAQGFGKLRKVLRGPAKVYQFEEQLFKMAFYIDKRKAGVGVRASIEAAEEALFNYRKVPDFIDKLRTTGLVPFVTFTYKAIPATVRGLAQRPAVFNQYGNIFRIFEDREKPALRRLLPGYMREGWMQLPTEKAGEVELLNLNYILPFTDVFELLGGGGPPTAGEQQPRAIRSLQEIAKRSPPLQVGAAIVFGADPFTGKEFRTPEDWGEWVTNFLAPPIAPGGYAFREISAAARGVPLRPLSPRAEPRELGQTIRAGIFGLRTRTINLAEQRRWRHYELTQEMMTLQRDLKYLRRARGKMDEQERQDGMKEVYDRIRALTSEYA